MVRSLTHLWRHHPVALILFGGASVLAVVFAVRVAIFALYWADPDHRHQVPEPWMTLGYVAHSWHLPPEEVFRAIGLPDRPGERVTLEEVAASRGVPVDQVMQELSAVLSTRAPRP